MRGLFGALTRETKAANGLTWGDINTLWGDLFGARESRAGVPVGWMASLHVSTILACARRISEAVSTVPMRLYKLDAATGKRAPASDHPLALLLDSEPNEWQDSLQFRDMLALHAAVAGNGYAFLSRRSAGGQILEMIPIPPDRCRVRLQPDGMPAYEVTAPDGSSQLIPASEMLHVRGTSWHGYVGLDTVQLAREAIGLSLAVERTHSALHANGARPSGVVSVSKTLNDAGLIRLASWVRKHYGGLDNAARVMVLDNDAKFTPFDMKGVDAQHIELRKHQIEEICAFMGVLPMVIGHPADMAARAAVDSLMTMHLVHTVRPWHRRFEKAFDRQLLTRKEREAGYYTKLIDGEFLRATAKDRAEYNRIALGGPNNPGWATQNEVRGWDDLDAHDGGDTLYTPANLAPSGATPPAAGA